MSFKQIMGVALHAILLSLAITTFAARLMFTEFSDLLFLSVVGSLLLFLWSYVLWRAIIKLRKTHALTITGTNDIGTYTITVNSPDLDRSRVEEIARHAERYLERNRNGD